MKKKIIRKKLQKPENISIIKVYKNKEKHCNSASRKVKKFKKFKKFKKNPQMTTKRFFNNKIYFLKTTMIKIL